MSVKYCATASFNRRLEKQQRLLVTYCFRDSLRDIKQSNPAVPVASQPTIHRSR